jgi:Ca-activated chloride channel family protein
MQYSLNREFLPSTMGSTTYLLVDITPSGLSLPSSRLRINASLLIDCSGSMFEKKLKNAKEGAKNFVDLLEPSDYVSVISFEAKPHTIVKGQHVTEKEKIKKSIDSISIGSRTSMYSGVKKAFEEIGNLKFTQLGEGLEPVRRLVLLSDGKPTDGVPVSDYAELAKTMRKQGITVTAIGIGDYDERYLQALADNSGGRWCHIKSPDNIKTLFGDEFHDIKTVVAPNMSLAIETTTIAELGKIYRSKPTFSEITTFERTEKGMEIPLSDLKQGETQQYIIEIGITPKIEGRFRVAEFVLKGYGIEKSENVIVTFTSDPSLYQREMSPLPTQVYREAATRVQILKAIDGDTRAKTLLKTTLAGKTQLSSQTVALGTEVVNKDGFTSEETKTIKQQTQIAK